MTKLEDEIEEAMKAMGKPMGRGAKQHPKVNAKLARHLISKCHYSKRQVAEHMKVSENQLNYALKKLKDVEKDEH